MAMQILDHNNINKHVGGLDKTNKAVKCGSKSGLRRYTESTYMGYSICTLYQLCVH
jgi:hypothetical protein